MIYIDQPSPTGFSYSEAVPGYITSLYAGVVQLPGTQCPSWAHNCGTYPSFAVQDTTNSTQGAAPDFWRVLQGFMGAFPQYSSSSFHFSTESYGGHYGPVYNAYILEQNDLIDSGELSGAQKIDLKSVMVGNGEQAEHLVFASLIISPANVLS